MFQTTNLIHVVSCFSRSRVSPADSTRCWQWAKHGETQQPMKMHCCRQIETTHSHITSSISFWLPKHVYYHSMMYCCFSCNCGVADDSGSTFILGYGVPGFDPYIFHLISTTTCTPLRCQMLPVPNKRCQRSMETTPRSHTMMQYLVDMQ